MVAAALTLPFDEARLLNQSLRAELLIVLRDMLVVGDLKKLAKKWEPARKLDAGMQASLKNDLIDLLLDRRPRFEGLNGLDLGSARANPAWARLIIERSLPTAEAKKLLKKWTGVRTSHTARDDIISQLLAVLDDQKLTARVA